MNRIVVLFASVAALLSVPALANEAGEVGDSYRIVLDRRMQGQTTDGGSSSSSDRWTMIERIIEIRPEGMLVEYDFDSGTSEGERASEWFYPALVLERADGTRALADPPGMEARVDAWLAKAGWTRELCGQWIFTWNAFQIECDPLAKLQGLDTFDIAPAELREGALHSEPKTLEPAPLVRESSGSGGAAYMARMQLDPQVLLDERASQRAIISGIMGEPVSEAQALAALAGAEFSGELTVRFETDNSGNVIRKHQTTQLRETGADGVTETTEINTVMTRSRID